MRILFLALLLVLVGCNTSKSVTPEGHNCSDLKFDKYWWREHVHKFFIEESICMTQIDSIFVEGEHICFVNECICSYEEDEWVMIIEQQSCEK